MAKILVVEDDAAIQGLTARSLELTGHEVLKASSGKEAIDRLGREPFDLVVLDLMLGEVSGYDVLGEMERTGLRRSTRVVVLTARAAERDILHGWRARVDEYCTKPFDPKDLVKTVAQTLERTPEQLAERREAELRKTELLYSVESAFDERR